MTGWPWSNSTIQAYNWRSWETLQEPQWGQSVFWQIFKVGSPSNIRQKHSKSRYDYHDDNDHYKHHHDKNLSIERVTKAVSATNSVCRSPLRTPCACGRGPVDHVLTEVMTVRMVRGVPVGKTAPPSRPSPGQPWASVGGCGQPGTRCCSYLPPAWKHMYHRHTVRAVWKATWASSIHLPSL